MLIKFNYYKPVVLLSLALVATACSGTPDRPVQMSTLPECGWMPNCVNTQSDVSEEKSLPVKSNDEQWEKLKIWMSNQQNWEITINEKNFIQAVVKTPVMRFRDDIQLLYFPDKQLIHVRSSSRLGFSDMGVNANRIESLRKLVKNI